jgi:hypothetical protein
MNVETDVNLAVNSCFIFFRTSAILTQDIYFLKSILDPHKNVTKQIDCTHIGILGDRKLYLRASNRNPLLF